MIKIKPEWLGYEIKLSMSYADGSDWGMRVDTHELDHVDTGHSDKVIRVESDAMGVLKDKHDKLAEQNEKMLAMLKGLVGTYDAGHYLEELTNSFEFDDARDLIAEIEGK